MSVANERFFAYRRVVVEVALAPDEIPGGAGGAEGATDDATDNPSMRRALRHEEDLLKALVLRLR
ncbi:MAG: hypothetical protein ACKV2O_16415 [Acidimicrobiales bacterium]